MDVGRVVLDGARLHPAAQPLPEPLVGAVDRPDGRICPAHLGHAGVEVEQPDQAGEVAGEVGDGEDGAAMRAQAREHMVAVLPHGLGDDERRVDGNGIEHLQAHPLAADEPVTCRRVDVVRPLDGPAKVTHGGGDDPLELDLCGPARCVGRFSEVAAGDEIGGARLQGRARGRPGQVVRRHRCSSAWHVGGYRHTLSEIDCQGQ